MSTVGTATPLFSAFEYKGEEGQAEKRPSDPKRLARDFKAGTCGLLQGNEVFRDQRGVFVVKETANQQGTASRQLTTGEQILFGNKLRPSGKVWVPNDSRKTGKLATFATENYQPEGPAKTVARGPLKAWK